MTLLKDATLKEIAEELLRRAERESTPSQSASVREPRVRSEIDPLTGGNAEGRKRKAQKVANDA